MKITIEKIKAYGVRRLFSLVVARLYILPKVYFYRFVLSDNSALLNRTKLNHATLFLGKGTININRATLGTWPSPYRYDGSGYIEARNHTARVSIGERTFINNAFVILADKTSISIGSSCLIGPRVFITDSDFHGIEIEDRRKSRYTCRSVVIGNEVFIGHDVKILKGVSIGDRSVIASGSVLVSDVPPDMVFGGNPARPLKQLRRSKKP